MSLLTRELPKLLREEPSKKEAKGEEPESNHLLLLAGQSRRGQGREEARSEERF